MNEMKKIGILLIGSVLSQVMHADTIREETAHSSGLVAQQTSPSPYNFKYSLTHGHGTLHLGGFWSTQGRSQQINLDDMIGEYFNVTKSKSGNFLVGVGYFINGPDIKSVKMSYGLDWFYLAKTQVKGIVLQEDNYSNLAYSYNVTHYPLYVVAKSTFQTVFPENEVSLDVGIGPNFMKTSHFLETSLGANTLPEAIFSGTTTTTFSATAGIDLKWSHFYGSSQAEFGYHFFYLGQGRFKPLTDQTLNNLTTGNGFANALVFSIIV